MGMPETTERWTADRVRALPDDGNRYELIAGELVVTPAPRGIHQAAVRELFRQLDATLVDSEAQVLWSPADLSLGEDEVLQPDLFVYRTGAGRILHEWADITELLLVVEVLSPSTAHYDRVLKRRRYQRAGVPEYWIVDLDARLIERWRPDDDRPEIIADRLQWELLPDAGALELDIGALFRSIWGTD